MAVAQNGEMSAAGSVLFLTVLGTVSQVLGFGYRVALSRMVGAEVMGLYQLLMPVYSVLLSLTAVGLTAAASNLTSQHLALGNGRGAAQVLGTCLRLLALVLLPVGGAAVLGSDAISVYLLGDARTQLGLVLLVPCAALTGVENLHKHVILWGRAGAPPRRDRAAGAGCAGSGSAGPSDLLSSPVSGAGGGSDRGGHGGL